jgi:glycosyltransferase involved in cell wall biosynthesis
MAGSLADITVVIKTFRRPAACFAAAQSWMRLFPAVPVVVVDDGGDEQEKPAKSLGNVRRYIETDFDIGLSAGRNLGVEACESRYVLVADDDNACREGTDLLKVISQMEAYDAGVVGTGAYWFVKNAAECVTVRGFPKVGGFTFCDITENHLVIDRSKVEVRWDGRLKIGCEHADFFMQCRDAGVTVAASQHIDFDHVASARGCEFYEKHRNRMDFRAIFRKKWGGVRVLGWEHVVCGDAAEVQEACRRHGYHVEQTILGDGWRSFRDSGSPQCREFRRKRRDARERRDAENQP